MSNAMTKSDAGLPAVASGSWGSEGLDNKDLLIPKLLLMQGLSELVAEGKAAMGDFVNSVTGEVLGNKTKPVEVIPICTFKTWVISEKLGDKFEYKEVVPWTTDNDAWKLEEMVNGVLLRRDRVLNYYVLLASEATRADCIPYLTSFRRTSYMAGRKIANHFGKCAMLDVPPASKTLKLTSNFEKNDLGNFYVYGVDEGRKTTDQELSKAYTWWKTLSQNKHKVDDSDLVAKEVEPTEDKY